MLCKLHLVTIQDTVVNFLKKRLTVFCHAMYKNHDCTTHSIELCCRKTWMNCTQYTWPDCSMQWNTILDFPEELSSNSFCSGQSIIIRHKTTTFTCSYCDTLDYLSLWRDELLLTILSISWKYCHHDRTSYKNILCSPPMSWQCHKKTCFWKSNEWIYSCDGKTVFTAV